MICCGSPHLQHGGSDDVVREVGRGEEGDVHGFGDGRQRSDVGRDIPVMSWRSSRGVQLWDRMSIWREKKIVHERRTSAEE